jgi:hypothetical protein
MKPLLFASALAIATAASPLPVLAAEVGVSVSIGQPGFYGHLNLGGYPPPQLVYPRPMNIRPVVVNRPPIYLNVPPGQARNWWRHCGVYNACNERVYFVRNDWYNREYVPRYQEYHRDRRNDHWDRRNDHRDNRDDRRHDYRNDHDRGQPYRYYGGGHGQQRDD